MEHIVKRLMENHRVNEDYAIVRIRRVCADTYNNYAYLQKGTKSTFKYGLGKGPEHIQRFSKDEAKKKLDSLIKNDDYIYKIISI